MFNKPTPPPAPLTFAWKPTKGKAMTFWLPDDEFDVMAVKYNIPITKDGFAVPRRWWEKVPQIFIRARCLDVFPHEVRHIEDMLQGRSNFHE